MSGHTGQVVLTGYPGIYKCLHSSAKNIIIKNDCSETSVAIVLMTNVVAIR